MKIRGGATIVDENNVNKADGAEGHIQKRIFNDDIGSSESNASSGESGHSTRQVVEVDVNKLIEFKDHPFEPYTDKRFNALVESIRYNSVHNPIIIRPSGEDMFEILSGHNRVRASKEADKQTIPAIIMTDLTEEVASLIVTETNLYQRSTTDMNPSELALALSVHYEATKKQGKRSDMIQVIEEIVNTSNDPDTSGTVYQKNDTRKHAGAIYGISSRSVGHYIRINELINPLKDMLDKGKIAKRTAVALSYLSEKDQETVHKVLEGTNRSLMESQAELLRESAKSKSLTQTKEIESKRIIISDAISIFK